MINAAGTVVDTTLAPSVSGIDVSDREHFKVQLDPAHDDLFISKPVFGRSSGRQTVQFSRKLLNKDGSFGGVAVVSVGCDELSNFYEALQVGGFVLLAGLDGIVRARGPVAAAQVSSDLRDEPYFADVISKRHGTIHDTDGPGRMHRILSYRQLENYPLFVLVGVDEEHVFAGYLATRNRWMSIGFIVTLIVALLGSCWIVQRRRSTASRRALLITLDSMSQGIVMTDARGRVPVMNRRAAELLDLPPKPCEATGLGLAEQLRLIGATGTDSERTLLRGSRIIDVQRHSTVLGGSVLTYTDVTERRRDEARILHLALHDGLTGLANRVLLTEDTADAEIQANASGLHYALVTIDLDGFKSINDGLGHDIGDIVLVRVAERLLSAVRANDTVARIGGDEFAVLVRNIPDPRIAEHIAQHLVDRLADPIEAAGNMCALGASAGVAVFPMDGLADKALMKNADIALYRAKDEGRGRFRRFDRKMCEALEERRWLERELRFGLERNQVEVYFQPQFAPDTLAITGFEALARWRHPERGYISPMVFIPVAEECGLVVKLGQAILEQACSFAVSWRPHCRVAVNLSPVQFRDADLPELVADILRRTGLPANLLELEITEGVLISDEEQALRTLGALREQGVRMALDDFGTGYSSLSYLRRFPFDRVKIDRSFVQAQHEDPRTRAIMDAVLAMSSSLGLSVTAEGVETPEQLDALREQGCTEVQGFLLGRPMPAESVPAFLAKSAANAQRPPALYVAASDGTRVAAVAASEHRAA